MYEASHRKSPSAQIPTMKRAHGSPNTAVKNIRDVHGDEITTQQREQAKQQWTTADILRQGSGTQQDIRLAFIALAQAAGFEARMAYLSTRDFFFFNPKITSTYFLNATIVAVTVGGEWKFYDVTDHAIPPGQLPWAMQGVNALITGPRPHSR
jgi:hypothetical protein